MTTSKVTLTTNRNPMNEFNKVSVESYTTVNWWTHNLGLSLSLTRRNWKQSLLFILLLFFVVARIDIDAKIALTLFNCGPSCIKADQFLHQRININIGIGWTTRCAGGTFHGIFVSIEHLQVPLGRLRLQRPLSVAAWNKAATEYGTL